MTFGDKLSALRREQNYTQEQLAELLGVSRQSVSKWESGAAYPETEKLIRLSALFDCSARLPAARCAARAGRTASGGTVPARRALHRQRAVPLL